MKEGHVVADRFRIEQLARSGGMGEIYVARDDRTDKRVALKVLRALDPAMVDRFEQEARVLAKLTHPAIVEYVAHGHEQGGLFIAMEWLDGQDLANELERGPLPVAKSIEIASRVAWALEWAHEQGVVHRDIKPSNIFIVNGRPEGLKVLDFGIARLTGESAVVTGTGTVMGTPAYMAPEQARGAREVDSRADVFALGCVLFECVTGRRAFPGEHPMAVLAKILFEDPPRLSTLAGSTVPAELEKLVAAMLSKNPESRPRHGGEIYKELERIRNGSAPDAEAARVERLSAAERRLVSVVVARSGTRTSTVDDVPTSTLRSAESTQRHDPLRAVVAPFGGQLEVLANGSLAVALSVRGTAPDQAVHAARCALSLRAAGVPPPIVVATGQGVDAGGRLPLGEAIDRAVGLLDECKALQDAGERASDAIVLDSVTAGLLDRRFEVVTLAGRSGAELRSERELEVARTVLGRPTPYVGRTRELANLNAIFNECAIDRVARAVLVTASAGIGKSRLRAEFLAGLREAGEKVEVWIARGDPISAGSPFSMIAPAIRRSAGITDGEPIESARTKLLARVARHSNAADLGRIAEFVGELVGVPFAEAESVQLREARRDPLLMGDQMRRAWEDLLVAECTAQPVLIVLEDLHWGDLPSVKFLDAVLRNLKDEPIMVLALARPDVHDLFPKLWQDRSLQIIRLSELTRRACETLIRAVLGDDVSADLSARLADRSKGNAFYLEELIRAEAEGTKVLPGTVLAMVQARMHALPSELRRVLRAASVFGELFWPRGVASLLAGLVVERDVEDALEALVTREVIARRLDRKFPLEDEYVFRHDLVQEAAYMMLTDADRVLAHRLAGDWLERAGERDHAVLAQHFERGAEPVRAALSYKRSAEQALDGNDFVQAISRAERALSLSSGGEPCAELKALQATACLWQGDFSRAEKCGLEAAAEHQPGSTAWFTSMTVVIEAAGKLGQYETVEKYLENVDSFDVDERSEVAQIECLASGAMILAQGGRPTTAAFADRAEERFSSGRHLDPRAKGRVMYLRGLRALSAGDVAGGVAAIESAQQHFVEAGDARWACIVQADLGYACSQLGLYEQAEKDLRSALTTGERLGLEWVVAGVQQNLGGALRYLGTADARREARELEEKAVLALRATGDRRLVGGALTYLASLEHEDGNFEVAEMTARQALDVLDAPPPRAFALAVLAQILLSIGRTADALVAATEAMGICESLGGIEEGETLVRLVYAEALAENDRRHDAERAAMAARERLLARAARVTRLDWRRTFLQRVPENVRTLALARRWAKERALELEREEQTLSDGEVFAQRFELSEIVAQKRSQRVYKALDRLTRTAVALRVLARDAPEAETEAFRRSARVWAELHHPGVPEYIAHGSTLADELYIASEWQQGNLLSTRIRRRTFSLDDVLSIAIDLASVLAAVHAVGFVHRAVAPENVLLVRAERMRARLLGFSAICSMSERAPALMTRYPAPEEARERVRLDGRADLFALGCTLFEAATGKPPFSAENATAFLAKVLAEAPLSLRSLRPDAPEALELLIARLLAKNPEERPADAVTVGRELEAIRKGIHESARGATPRLTNQEQRLMAVVVVRRADVPSTRDAPLMAASLMEVMRAAAQTFGAEARPGPRDTLLAILAGRDNAADLAADAVRCAQAIQESGLCDSIAITTGRGIVEQSTVAGDAVERAIALCDDLPANERIIAIDEIAAPLLERRFEIRRQAAWFSVGAEHEGQWDFERTLLGRPTPFVGRARELTVLETAYAQCVEDSVSSAVLVVAPAGTGKSRLLHELLRRLGRREDAPQVWTAHGDSLSSGSPFGMIAQVVQRALGIVAGAPLASRRDSLRSRVANHFSGESAERIAEFLGEIIDVSTESPSAELNAARSDPILMGDQIQRAWEDWLAAECAKRPIVLVLEDLHWGDFPSVKLIDGALRNLAERPFLVLAVARPEVHERFPGLWTNRTLAQVRLGELNARASEALVRFVLGRDVDDATVAGIVRRSGGNAFFLEELIRAVADHAERPGTPLAMVQARLESLPHSARRVLRSASLYGQRFWAGGLAVLLEDAGANVVETALDSLRDRELIEPMTETRFPGERQYAFRHELVHRAAYETFTDEDRTLGHRLAGEWLERAGERDAIVLAEHFERGRDFSRALEWYHRAAEQALEGNDFAQAVGHGQRAISLGAEGWELAALEELQAVAHFWRGEFSLAAECGTAAAGHYSRESVGWLRAMGTLMEARGHLGDYDAVEHCMQEVAARPFPPEAGCLQVECLARGAMLLVSGGKEEAASLFDRRLEDLTARERRLDARARGRLQYLRGFRALQGGDVARAFSGLSAACDEFRKAGDARAVCTAEVDLGYTCAQIGLYDRARTELESALSTAQRMGLQRVAAGCQQNLGLVLSYCGNADLIPQARELEQEAARAFEVQGDRRMMGAAWTYLAIIQQRAGDYRSAEYEARRAVAVLDGVPPIRAFALAVLSRALLAQGRAADALPPAVEAMDLLTALGGIDDGEALVRLAYAETLNANGRTDEARKAGASARERLLERAAKIESPDWREDFVRNIPENAETLALTLE